MVAVCIADPMTVLQTQSQLKYGKEPMVSSQAVLSLKGQIL